MAAEISRHYIAILACNNPYGGHSCALEKEYLAKGERGMLFAGYELLAQHSAGKDGISYQATAESGTLVELRDLTRARGHRHRWTRVVRRLQRAASFADPNALKVLDLQCEGEPPVLVLEWVDTTTLAERIHPGKVLIADPHGFATELSNTIAHAHEQGLTHGGICPSQVKVGAQDKPTIDFTAFLRLGLPEPPETIQFDELCRASPSTQFATDPSADDIYAVGVVLALLLGCDAQTLRAHREMGEEKRLGDCLSPELDRLLRAMLAAGPLRPSVGIRSCCSTPTTCRQRRAGIRRRVEHTNAGIR